MNQEKPLGTGWFTFVNYVWLPCTIIGLLISAIVVLSNWNSTSAETFTEIVILLGIQIAIYVGMERRKQWAWWLLMITMFVGGPSAAYSRYVAHAEWIDLCNEASQQTGGSPVSTTPEQYIALGVTAFLLFGVPNLIYFYRRRKWFGVDFTENADENKPGETANTIQPNKAEQAPNAIKVAGYSENAESDDRELYAQAYREAQDESDGRDVGLWAMIFANTGGDRNRCQAEYIRQRVVALQNERQTRLQSEQIIQKENAAIKMAAKDKLEREEGVLSRAQKEIEAIGKIENTVKQIEGLPPLINNAEWCDETATQAVMVNKQIDAIREEKLHVLSDSIRQELASLLKDLEDHPNKPPSTPLFVLYYGKFLSECVDASDLPAIWQSLLEVVKEQYNTKMLEHDYAAAEWYAYRWQKWQLGDKAGAANDALEKATAARAALDLVDAGIRSRKYSETIVGLNRLIALFGDTQNLEVEDWNGTLTELLSKARTAQKIKFRRQIEVAVTLFVLTTVSIITIHVFKVDRETALLENQIETKVIPQLASQTGDIAVAKAAMEENRLLSKRADDVLLKYVNKHFLPRASDGDATSAAVIGFCLANGFGYASNDVAAAGWIRKAAENGLSIAQNKLGAMYASGHGVTKDDSEAVKWYRTAAVQGCAVAMYNLAKMYEIGRGVDKDEVEAVKWYRKAGEIQYKRAQNKLGDMYANGTYVQKNIETAAYWYRQAAGNGYAIAQYNLGLMYATADGVKQDDAEAVKWFTKAANQGNTDAQNGLGVMYASGRGVQSNAVEAVNWYQKAAEQGNAKAQRNLGFIYAEGSGVPKDETAAINWFRKAAEQGDDDLQFTLGVRYENGLGVAIDSHEAAKWYLKAASNGVLDAQCNLGNMYENGKGVQKDKVAAVHWYKMAAEGGEAIAQLIMAEKYLKGDGVERDDREAIRWMRKAADQGQSLAQYTLGLAYETGAIVPVDIVPVDNDLAILWYRKAAENNDAEAQFRLGCMYGGGRGVYQNDVEAFRWISKSAENGNAVAQAMVGNLYGEGKGVAKNETEAIWWYRKSADQGNADAQLFLGCVYENGVGVSEDRAAAICLYRKSAAQGNENAKRALLNLGIK